MGVISGLFKATLGGGARRMVTGTVAGGIYGGATTESATGTGVFQDIARGATWGGLGGALTTRTSLRGLGYMSRGPARILGVKRPPKNVPWVREHWSSQIGRGAVAKGLGSATRAAGRGLAGVKRPPKDVPWVQESWGSQAVRANRARLKGLGDTVAKGLGIKPVPQDVPWVVEQWSSQIKRGPIARHPYAAAGIAGGLALGGYGMYSLATNRSSLHKNADLGSLSDYAEHLGTSTGVMSRQQFQNSTHGLVQGLHRGRSG